MKHLYYFPGAGSFGTELNDVRALLGGRLTTIQYPGRAGHGFGVPAESFAEVVGAALALMKHDASSCVLLGHSYGAYVAFSVARALESAAPSASATLIVAGAASPRRLRLPWSGAPTLSQTEEFLLNTDPKIFDRIPGGEWRELLVEAAASDLGLLLGFSGLTHSIRGNIAAWYGIEDPLTSHESTSDWRNYCQGQFALTDFPGGHSEMLTDAPRRIALLCNSMGMPTPEMNNAHSSYLSII